MGKGFSPRGCAGVKKFLAFRTLNPQPSVWNAILHRFTHKLKCKNYGWTLVQSATLGWSRVEAICQAQPSPPFMCQRESMCTEYVHVFGPCRQDRDIPNKRGIPTIPPDYVTGLSDRDPALPRGLLCTSHSPLGHAELGLGSQEPQGPYVALGERRGTGRGPSRRPQKEVPEGGPSRS
uniref:Uncharacterized protein n=1 Tax=Knipowitschia caucasica TaxID=637954 RepID=A0AAV2IVK5_KNICA